MTLTALEREITETEERFSSLMNVIVGLRRQVESLTNQADSGGKIDTTETKQSLTQLNAVVLACNRAEETLNDCRNRQAGIVRGGYALDMQKARVEIGCKLDQLRCVANPD